MKSKKGFIVAIGILVCILIGVIYFTSKNSNKDSSTLMIGYAQLEDGDLTDNTLLVDEVEQITSENKKRIKELHLENESFPDGYYIYNPDTSTTTINVNEQTMYEFHILEELDPNDEKAGKYITLSKTVFVDHLQTLKEGQTPPLLEIEIKDGVAVSIKQQLNNK